MLILIEIVLPVFVIMGIGYLAAFFRLFDQHMASGLAKFVFNFALPVMLFTRLSSQALPSEIPLSLFVSYYGGIASCMFLSVLAYRHLIQKDYQTSLMLGFGSTYGNSVLVGIPLVLSAFGDDASVPLFLLISFYSIIFFTILIVSMESASPQGWRKILQGVVKRLVQNPILGGLVFGVSANLLDLHPPDFAMKPMEMLGAAALPCALFSLGVSLNQYKTGPVISTAFIMCAIKLVLQPLIVFILAFFVFSLPLLWAKTAVLTASVPIGVNAYLFATRYETAKAEIAAAIILSTVLSIITITLTLIGLEMIEAVK